MIITMNRINSENFYQEPKTGKLMAKKTGHNIEVTPGSYVVTTVESRTFNDMDSIIMAMGELNRLATDEEISDSFKQEYAGDDQVVDFNDYMLRDNEEEEFNEEEDDNMSQDEKEESALQND